MSDYTNPSEKEKEEKGGFSSEYRKPLELITYEETTEGYTENVFGVGEIMLPLPEISFEQHVWSRARELFSAALRELGYFGDVAELEAFNFQMRDKHGNVSIEVFAQDNGDYHLRMNAGKTREIPKLSQPILIKGGN